MLRQFFVKGSAVTMDGVQTSSMTSTKVDRVVRDAVRQRVDGVVCRHRSVLKTQASCYWHEHKHDDHAAQNATCNLTMFGDITGTVVQVSFFDVVIIILNEFMFRVALFRDHNALPKCFQRCVNFGAICTDRTCATCPVGCRRPDTDAFVRVVPKAEGTRRT